MTIYFYNATSSELIATTSISASGSTSTATTSWSGLGYEVNYEWYAVADDGIFTATSSTWNFTTISQSPSAPTDLKTEGATNPSGVSDLTPEFTAVGNDPDSGDTLTHAYIQVGTATATIDNMWDSGWIDIENFTEGTTSPEISYGSQGSPTTLATDGTTYYWRIRFKDDTEAVGDWSTVEASFKMAQAVYYAQRSSSTSSDASWDSETEIGVDHDGYGHMSLVPLASGDIMAIYNDKIDSTYYLKYKIYDAGTTSWGSESTIISDCQNNTTKDNWDEYHWFSAITDSSNNVHLVYIDSLNDDLFHTSYNGSVWSSTSTVYSSSTALTHPTLSYDSQYDSLYALWIEGTNVNYKRYLSSSWDAAATTLDSVLTSPNYLGSAYSASSSIGVIWRENSSSPYEISYATISIAAGAATIDLSGTVYSDEGDTELTSEPIVSLAINSSWTASTTASSVDGSYSFNGQSISSSDIITIYLEGADKAVTVTKGVSANVSDFDLYQNRVIVRQEGGDALTISDMDNYDSGQDADILYTAGATLIVNAEAELYIWPNKEFAPGGDITIDAGGSGDSWDGSLKICLGSTFTAAGSESHSIGGSWIASSTATFTPANSTITFISTAGSKTITTAGNDFYNLIFNGSSGAWTFQDNVTSTNNFTISDGTITGPSSGIIAVQNNWLNDGGTFTHNNSTVLFYATDSGNTITSGSSAFYNLEFNGSNGEWLYKDGANGTNQTTVKAGTATFLNTRPGTVSVTGGTLNVDWYLGGHVVNANATSSNITSATTTISEESTTSQSTIWEWSGGVWGTASTSQTILTDASGLFPQPGTNGAIRIREYSATSTGSAYYKYNLAIMANGYSNYNYYNDQGTKYIASASSSDGDVDTCISETWQRDDIDANNTEQTLDEPPTTGTWYVGMDSDLEFGLDSLTVNIGPLNDINNFTATATTITYVTSTAGYLIQVYDSAGNDGELTATSGPSISRWDYNNDAPDPWGTYCKNNASFCGFGYTTSDDNLTGDNRFGSATEYAGFTSSTEPVADRGTGNWGGEQDTITYKVSVSETQEPETYDTTITYVCTAQY